MDVRYLLSTVCVPNTVRLRKPVNPFNNPSWKMCFHFTDERLKNKGNMTWPRACSHSKAEPEFRPRLLTQEPGPQAPKAGLRGQFEAGARSHAAVSLSPEWHWS